MPCAQAQLAISPPNNFSQGSSTNWRIVFPLVGLSILCMSFDMQANRQHSILQKPKRYNRYNPEQEQKWGAALLRSGVGLICRLSEANSAGFNKDIP